MFNFFKNKKVACEPPAASSTDQPADATAPVEQKEEGALQYEKYSREWSEMSMQDNFDGFRLESGKSVNKLMQASHSLFLGTSLRETGYIYQFGPTFHDPAKGLTLVGRLGLDGGIHARGMKKMGPLEMRLTANSNLKKQEMNLYEFTAELGRPSWAACIKSCWQMTWMMNGHFSQKVTKNLHMGGDLTWIAANGATIGALGLRYTPGKDIWSMTLTRQPDFKSGPMNNLHAFKVQYMRKISERLNLGTEFEYTSPTQESALRMAYETVFRQARVQGQVDTSGKISCFVHDLAGFGLSGMIDYMRSDYKFGFMLHMMPGPEEGPQ